MQFEYKQVVQRALLNEPELNLLGDERWELTCTLLTGDFIAYFFKRDKEEVLEK